jgi:DNA-binding response OmpR family regulator
MTRILIVEDEERIASFIDMGLRAAGFETELAATGRAALSAVRTQAPDLILLDLGLPDSDGMQVLRRLRDDGDHTPVVILTARSDVIDVVAGFDAGAQDFLPKPFAFEELLVRVRARVGEQQRTLPSTRLVSGGVELDLTGRRVSVAGRAVELSSREFALLEMFIRHPGQVLTRVQLLETVWGLDFDPGSNVVDVYVGYVRRKVGAERIDTVRGMGYRWR